MYVVENTSTCCGQHKKHVTHNISSPTRYTMSGCCPQHIPTICARCPQHMYTHKLYTPQHMIVLHNIITTTVACVTHVLKHVLRMSLSQNVCNTRFHNTRFRFFLIRLTRRNYTFSQHTFSGFSNITRFHNTRFHNTRFRNTRLPRV